MWPIPEPDEAKLWLRFDCPFCVGKSGNTAAISYTRQRFECFRCDKTIGYSARSNPEDEARVTALLDQYREPINNVISWVLAKVGRQDEAGRFRAWVTADELHTQAAWLIWNYSCRAYGAPNDAGMWDEWEAITDGDPDRMAQYVGQALKGDLLTYATKEHKWKSEVGITDVQPIRIEHSRILKTGIADFRDSLLNLAERDEVAFTSWGSSGCERARNGLPPIAGHCQRCNLALT
jgi:hypothetical protein